MHLKLDVKILFDRIILVLDPEIRKKVGKKFVLEQEFHGRFFFHHLLGIEM